MFSPRPRVLKKGTATAVAEAAAAAAAAHAASELADLEKKAPFYDTAIRDDEGPRDRARRAESDDPLRQGMVARTRLDEQERRQEQFREVLELCAAENLSAVEAAEAATRDDLSEKWVPEMNVEDNGTGSGTSTWWRRCARGRSWT